MKILVNGLEQDVFYDTHALDEILIPALRTWASTPKPEPGISFAFLAAPPGSGKSTLAALLATAIPEIQFVSLDGFHLPQAVLEERTIIRDEQRVPLAAVKGSPESFDLEGLECALAAGSAGRPVAWPHYDRRLHDVVTPPEPNLTASHVVVEGNWLLLNEPRWRELRRFASLTVFVAAPEDLLKERLIQRKIQGGKTPREAADFYLRSDGPNVERTLANSEQVDVDLSLVMDAQGHIHERKGQ